MNELVCFSSPEFGEIRTLEENGAVLFCGTDVARAMGYARPNAAVSVHCRATVKRSSPISGKMQDINFIPESDLYRLAFSSKLPTAERFTDWVTEEVLPSIRKTGGYVGNDDLFLQTYLPNADEATRAMFRSTLATVRSLNAKIEADKPKVLFADAVSTAKTSILVGELAKLLKQNGVDIGQNRLFEWLRGNGYLVRRRGSDYNMPTQRAMDLGLFEIKETAIAHSDGHTSISKTTKVSAKGQWYFINAFLGNRKRSG